jgi:type II secretory pathway pseudopilin PulG
MTREKGFTLIEVCIGFTLFAVVAAAGYALIQYSVATSLHQERVMKRNRAMAEMERAISAVSTAVTEAMMNPEQSLLLTASGHVAAGSIWNSEKPVAQGDVPATSILGFNGRPGSHGLLDFQLSLNSDNSVEQRVNAIHLSRCIDGRNEPPAQLTTAYVNSLRVPVIRNGKMLCCTLRDGQKPNLGECEENPFFWPKVFTLNARAGAITMAPVSVDENVLPGAGFVLSFDKNPPTQFYVDFMFLKNNCTAGTVRKSTRCPNTQAGKVTIADRPLLERELVMEFKRVTRLVSSDISGSSFIRLAPRTIEKK